MEPDRVVFLDRDGVVNEDTRNYVRSVEDWRPLPGSLEAIARLTQAGYRVAIMTNQSGLARGLFDRAMLDAIHDRLRSDVAAVGGRIDGIFVCPHRPDEGCDCRKPAPGLFRQAELTLGVVARGAPFVGDRASDLRAARAAGCRPVLVESGKGFGELRQEELADVLICRDLDQFVEVFLGDDRTRSTPVRRGREIR